METTAPPVRSFGFDATTIRSIGVGIRSCCPLAAIFLSGTLFAIDFNRDVRPLLAKHCYACHGPDEASREADLRLDILAADPNALAAQSVIDPGDASASELIARIESDDDDVRMPPPKYGPRLKDNEIATLREWIDEGANSQEHWAFLHPQQAPVPDVQQPARSRGVIDRFIQAKIDQAGLNASDPANRRDLIRRLSLDLTGLPPTPDQVDRFVANESPKALTRLIDELLASPEYGERMATQWLDLARYADTNGYEKDRPRTIWPYRDWVVRSLSADMPFDQFTIEQLAGDMLPGATPDQIVATGFHRNTMLNEEGGIDPLEYRYLAMIDRVGTTGTIWMGLTVGCAQCHTHKYDPITHTDFYAMYALLDQADEPEYELRDATVVRERERILAEIRGAEDELIRSALVTPDQDASQSNDESSAIRKEFDTWLEARVAQSTVWQVLEPTTLDATTPKLERLSDGSILASGDVTKREVYELTLPPTPAGVSYTALRLEALPHESLPAGGPGMAFYEGRRGDFFLSEFDVTRGAEEISLVSPSHSFGKISIGSGSAAAEGVLDGDGSTGWSTATQEGRAHRLVLNFDKPFSSAEPWKITMLFERHFAASLGHFRVSATSRDDAPVVASPFDAELEQQMAAARANGQPLTSETLDALRREFVRVAESLAGKRAQLKQLESQLPEFTRTLVMRERPSDDYRTTHRHHRGEYLQPREVVGPGVPGLFRAESTDNPRDRLEFARWLVSDANPLAARVTVDRAWRTFFGEGLVRTAGDYGTTCEPPSHPELLDFLAVDLREQGWSLKRLHREIVHSSTYMQQLAAPPTSDPDNRLLSCYPYRRLHAEQIRDSFLAASGGLTRVVGGPSVYPPQPTGVAELAYGNEKWPVSAGGDRYRRSLYTFRKRTAPFAAYAVFDAPTGEVCLARRDSSTTPLQSLTLLNDEMFMDLAERASQQARRNVGPDATPRDVAHELFRLVLSRSPAEDEVDRLVAFFDDLQGEVTNADSRWMLVARALFNSDEAITIP